MRTACAAATVVLALALCLRAQERPSRLDVFGGYSLLHSSDFNLSGWEAAPTVNIGQIFGITSAISGHYSRQESSGTNLKSSIYSFMFGPQLAYRSRRYTPLVHALFGFSHQTDQATVSGTELPSTAENYFRMAIGGGVDVSVGRSVALRPVRADFVLFRLADHSFKEFRYAGGLVFRLGRK